MHKFLFHNKIHYMSLHVSSTTCSKHVETYNESYYETRICALSWLITKIILRCTVSTTSKCHKVLVLLVTRFMWKQAPAISEELLYFQFGIAIEYTLQRMRPYCRLNISSITPCSVSTFTILHSFANIVSPNDICEYSFSIQLLFCTLLINTRACATGCNTELTECCLHCQIVFTKKEFRYYLMFIGPCVILIVE